MTRYTTTDVLICGAGVTGLTLAIELARHGVSFRLIEKRTTPFIGSRGKGIQPRTQEIFEDLGILNKVVAAGGLYPRLRTYRHDGSYVDSDIAHHTKPTHAEPYHLPLMVPQNVTETIMREQLKAWGHRVEFGCELRHFAQTPRTVTAYVAGPAGEEVIIAHYLIGADGGGSFVRKKLGVSFPGRTLGIHALVADASLSGLNRDVWHHFNDGDMARMITICPLAGTQLFQIQALLAPDDSQNFSADVLTAFLTERIGRTDVRIHSIPWVSKYQMNARIAEHYRVGKVFLAGDAAHVHPPTGGQGLNTSIQDAYNLGWKMAASLRGAGEELLDSYEQERRPIAESLLHLSTRLLDSQKQRGIKRERDVQQLDIQYTNSPLAHTLPERQHGLQAGERAPDAPLLGAGGQSLRLFQLLQGPDWNLLAYETHGKVIDARRGLRIHHIGEQDELIDTLGHFRESYHLAPGQCVLIRPDGYVGAFFHGKQSNDIENYLSRFAIGMHVDGAMQEVVTHPAHLIHKIPDNVPSEMAPLAEPLTIALHALHRANVKAGEYVAIIGAGAIGLMAALSARHYKATPILIDIVEERLRYAQKLGVPYVLNAADDQVIDAIKNITHGTMAQVVIEASGANSAIRNTLDLASFAGRISFTGWPKQETSLPTNLITYKELDLRGSRTSAGEFDEALRMLSTLEINPQDVVSKVVNLDEIPDAVKELDRYPERYLKINAVFH
ncbi:zinc-binding dehydrogenase [Salmonella enterica]|nr:zinc-binding dehydrogenase [Salmonella enterica]